MLSTIQPWYRASSDCTWRKTPFTHEGKQANVSRKLSQTTYRREKKKKKLIIPHHKKNLNVVRVYKGLL
jgi:hypothetical protein